LDSRILAKPDHEHPTGKASYKKQTNEVYPEKEIWDILTLAEPVACVLHAYKRLPTLFVARNITVFGAGPMGILHVLQARQEFPSASIAIVEPNAVRRQLAGRLLPFASVHNSVEKIEETDLAVVATGNPQAPLTAIRTTAAAGVVLLFSGPNHRNPSQVPRYEGHDLDEIHRNEEVKITSRAIRLIGSNGYQPYEIGEAAKQLVFMRGTYALLQTGIIDGVGSFAMGAKDFGEVAIIKMLTDDSLYTRHLKVIIRNDQRRMAESHLLIGKNGKNLELQHFKLGMGVQPGMVRVRMRRMSICAADRLVLKDTKSGQLKAGLVLGHEGVGVVEAVGPSVPRSLLYKTCILVPHHFHGEDQIDGLGIGCLAKPPRQLGRDIDGVFTTCADFPVRCIYPLDDSLLNGLKTRCQDWSTGALSPYD